MRARHRTSSRANFPTNPRGALHWTAMSNEGDIKKRKLDHLELCASDQVSFKEQTTLLECVRFLHSSLPELSLDEIDLSVRFLGKELRAPILIAGMTGGHERSREINRGLARVAEERGYAFGLGSQRALLRDPSLGSTYEVRDIAPTLPLLGNLGVIQARELEAKVIRDSLASLGADALCLHMNPAMELIQEEGDRDFRGGLRTFERLGSELGLPIIAKETGAGISFDTAHALHQIGIRYIDTSGAGGTSWVGVETLRAEGARQRLGELLWDWGIPTAASIVHAVRAGHHTIATGGIQTGLDIARAIALGADLAGIARGAYQAFHEGGEASVHALFDQIELELRSVMLLVGAADLAALQDAPKLIRGELRDYLELIE